MNLQKRKKRAKRKARRGQLMRTGAAEKYSLAETMEQQQLKIAKRKARWAAHLKRKERGNIAGARRDCRSNGKAGSRDREAAYPHRRAGSRKDLATRLSRRD